MRPLPRGLGFSAGCQEADRPAWPGRGGWRRRVFGGGGDRAGEKDWRGSSSQGARNRCLRNRRTARWHGAPRGTELGASERGWGWGWESGHSARVISALGTAELGKIPSPCYRSIEEQKRVGRAGKFGPHLQLPPLSLPSHPCSSLLGKPRK